MEKDGIQSRSFDTEKKIIQLKQEIENEDANSFSNQDVKMDQLQNATDYKEKDP